jgi:hypothetical protein
MLPIQTTFLVTPRGSILTEVAVLWDVTLRGYVVDRYCSRLLYPEDSATDFSEKVATHYRYMWRQIPENLIFVFAAVEFP